MKKKAFSIRALLVRGFLLGLVIAALRKIWKPVADAPGFNTDEVADKARQLASGVSERASDLLGGEETIQEDLPTTEADDLEASPDVNTVVEGVTSGNEDLNHAQHEGLGGIPDNTGREEDTFDRGLSSASDFSTGRSPYDADVSDEGVVLSYSDDTDRQVDVPLDEGIPNLGEPGDVEDVGPETLSEAAVVDEVESGVPELYGQDDDIDSVTYDEPWVFAEPGDSMDAPAASRGYREYGESTADERDVEDMSDMDDLGLLDEVDPSGVGGETDIENDEAPAWEDSGLTVVDEPDEPLGADAFSQLDDEETLGLRDSESPAVSGDLLLDDPANTTAGSQYLGVTGDSDEAHATERISATQREPGVDTQEGTDLQESFATGDQHPGSTDGAKGVDARESGDFGRTDEFGIPAESSDGHNASGAIADQNDSDGGRQRQIISPRRDGDHLGISGDFDKAEKTEVIPAESTEDDAPADSETSRESFVTGDDEDGATSRESDAGEQNGSSSSDSESGDASAFSAAWSTPAGVVRQPSGQPGEAESVDSASDAGNDAEDQTAAAVGDLGTASSIAHEGIDSRIHTADESTQDVGLESSNRIAGTDVSAGSGREESSSRKSRKQRKQLSGSVPQGAVQGDGNPVCPTEFPIKGNANSRIYHRPTDPSYEPTIPEYCFATEEDAQKAGFRAPRG